MGKSKSKSMKALNSDLEEGQGVFLAPPGSSHRGENTRSFLSPLVSWEGVEAMR